MRVYRSLNPLEKIVYSLTRAILTNRYSRNAFFVYCVGLHLLVVFVIYWLATIEVSLHFSSLADGQHVGNVVTLGTGSENEHK